MDDATTAATSTRILGIVAFLVAAAAIAGAWGFELIGGYIPCALCLEQRTPYYVALPVIAASVLIARRRPSLARLGFLIGGTALLWSAGLGVYHAGAEWGFWAGPSDCAGQDTMVRDASSLLQQLSAVRLVSCTEAAVRFLGLSFPGWNVIAAVSAAALAFAGAIGGGRGSPRRGHAAPLAARH